MVEARLSLTNEVGLHARPAAMLVKCAARFKCQVTVAAGNKKANGKSIMSILSLGAIKGDELLITAEGSDETACIEELSRLITAGFGEGGSSA